MSCPHTRAVLDGEAPHVDVSAHVHGCRDCRDHAAALDHVDAMFHNLQPPPLPGDLLADTLAIIDDAFDAARDGELFTALAPPAVPAALRARTLTAVDAEMGIRPARRWRRAAPLVLLAAAALLVVALPSDDAPDISTFSVKGPGASLPHLDLKVVVEQGGVLARYRADTPYHVGDAFYFRVSVDTPATATLLHIVGDEAVVVHAQPVEGLGDEDLRIDGQPLAWELEPGEQAASLVVLAGEPLPVESVGLDGQATCAALASAFAVSCARIDVEVAP